MADEVCLPPVVPGSAAARSSFPDEQVFPAQGPSASGRDTCTRRYSAAGADRRAAPGPRAHPRVLGETRVIEAFRGGATAARPALVRGTLAKIPSCLSRGLVGGARGAPTVR